MSEPSVETTTRDVLRDSEPDHEGSTLALGLGCQRSGDGTLPHVSVDRLLPMRSPRATVEAPALREPKPCPSNERDHELIDYLVRKAIEKCMLRTPSTLERREREG